MLTRVRGWQGYYCAAQNSHRALVGRERVPSWLLAALVSKASFWLGGLLAGISVLIEAKHRRGELAMYVLPKGLESAWVAARGKGLVFRTGKHGNELVRVPSFHTIGEGWEAYCVSLVDCDWDGNGHGTSFMECPAGSWFVLIRCLWFTSFLEHISGSLLVGVFPHIHSCST